MRTGRRRTASSCHRSAQADHQSGGDIPDRSSQGNWSLCDAKQPVPWREGWAVFVGEWTRREEDLADHLLMELQMTIVFRHGMSAVIGTSHVFI